jgi:hypothetical protein
MIVVYLDAAGLAKVEIVAPAGAQAEYHKLFAALRAAIENLDAAVKNAAEAGDGDARHSEGT